MGRDRGSGRGPGPRPADGARKPASMCSRVVLPAPLGPSRPVTPAPRLKLTSLTATTLPYQRAAWTSSMAGRDAVELPAARQRHAGILRYRSSSIPAKTRQLASAANRYGSAGQRRRELSWSRGPGRRTSGGRRQGRDGRQQHQLVRPRPVGRLADRVDGRRDRLHQQHVGHDPDRGVGPTRRERREGQRDRGHAHGDQRIGRDRAAEPWAARRRSPRTCPASSGRRRRTGRRSGPSGR